MSQDFKVIGVMSGTSLDGLDICCCSFTKAENGYQFKIIAAESYSYSTEFRNMLKSAYHLKIDELTEIDQEFARYTAKMINHFILEKGLTNQIDLIGSHGQTIFHQPEKGITVQIGDGQLIADLTKTKTINNFRIKDVELGGQGAPLVPIGDRLLFGEAEACLNLGGIANISFENEGKRIAFDICPANLPLNKIVEEKFNIPFDKNGEIARSGNCIETMLDGLNKLDFYSQPHPKSLGQEWLDQHFYPILKEYAHKPTAHILNTIVHHEVFQLSEIINRFSLTSILVTGGGALNSYFIESLRKKTSAKVILPELQIIEFKEALIFAFLAFLNVNDQVNTLASVTGANRDSIGGISWNPFT